MQSQLCRYQITSTYLSVLTRLDHETDRQDKQILTHGTFKNTGSKPVRGRYHGCRALTLKKALGT